MYGCESWTIKKAERRRIDTFELWCWRTLLKCPLDCKEIQPVDSKGNQYWMFIGSTNAEAETPNTLATWCEQQTHLKRPWCWELLKAGEGDDRGWDGWMASLTWWPQVWARSRSLWWTGIPGVLQSMRSQSSYMTEQLNWSDSLKCQFSIFNYLNMKVFHLWLLLCNELSRVSIFNTFLWHYILQEMCSLNKQKF